MKPKCGVASVWEILAQGKRMIETRCHFLACLCQPCNKLIMLTISIQGARVNSSVRKALPGQNEIFFFSPRNRRKLCLYPISLGCAVCPFFSWASFSFALRWILFTKSLTREVSLMWTCGGTAPRSRILNVLKGGGKWWDCIPQVVRAHTLSFGWGTSAAHWASWADGCVPSMCLSV